MVVELDENPLHALKLGIAQQIALRPFDIHHQHVDVMLLDEGVDILRADFDAAFIGALLFVHG